MNTQTIAINSVNPADAIAIARAKDLDPSDLDRLLDYEEDMSRRVAFKALYHLVTYEVRRY